MQETNAIKLADIIKTWLLENKAHHRVWEMHYAVNAEIECTCAIDSHFAFIITPTLVRIYPFGLTTSFALPATDPNFFDKLRAFLEQDCSKKSL